MALKTTPFPRPALGAVALACAQLATAQQTAGDPAGPAALPRVTVQQPALPSAPGVAGFGDRPLETLPLTASVIDREQIDALGARRLADLIKLDASLGDAYNSPGYWDFLSVRGFVLDQRFNYRREGLPVSAETAIPLDNKQRVELLKGTSGIQAGTSAPGGLVNYVVKRPTVQPLRSATLTLGERGSVGAAIDLSDRLAGASEFGWRLNVAQESRDPVIDAYGRSRRSVVAMAGDWRPADGATIVEAEVEWSQQKSASLPGFSLLGDTLPAVRRPFNLNNQLWSLPNEFDGLTGTLRLDQRLSDAWRWVMQAGTQRLRSDDRLAFPFGCFDAATEVYHADRYCPNGDFDLYDFRSENERRRTTAGQTYLQGGLRTGPFSHDMRAGVLASRLRYDFQTNVFQFVGTGNIDGRPLPGVEPVPNDEATERTERSLEWFAHDAINFGSGWTLWLGLRHTRLHRSSIRTDGSRATGYGQKIATPWAALSYAWAPGQQVYASWGRGAESAIVPGRPDRYANAGEALPALKSRQWELGAKGTLGQGSWSLAWFDIDRPAVTDTGSAYFIDGSARHRGVEASASQDWGRWTLRGSAMLLDAERRGGSDAAVNGQRPINVPDRTLRLQGRYRVPAISGLELGADLAHEGRRSVLADGSIELPSWTRTDVALRYVQQAGSGTLTWRLGIDNLFDRRAWKESPFQFGHVYLYSLEARTARLSVTATY